MLVLDISVTNVALASIRADLDFAVGDLQWIITAYTLVFGSLLIFFGRMGDLYGRRRLFVVGTAVFSAASLLCGLAQTPAQPGRRRAARAANRRTRSAGHCARPRRCAGRHHRPTGARA
jgi:MFS family permease